MLLLSNLRQHSLREMADYLLGRGSIRQKKEYLAIQAVFVAKPYWFN